MQRVIATLALGSVLASFVIGQESAESDRATLATAGRYSFAAIERGNRRDPYDLEIFLLETTTGRAWCAMRSTADKIFLGSSPSQTKWLRLNPPRELAKRDGGRAGTFEIDGWSSGDKKRVVISDTTTGDSWILAYRATNATEHQSNSDESANWGWQSIPRLDTNGDISRVTIGSANAFRENFGSATMKIHLGPRRGSRPPSLVTWH